MHHLHTTIQLKGFWLHEEGFAEAAEEPWQRDGRPTPIPHNLCALTPSLRPKIKPVHGQGRTSALV